MSYNANQGWSHHWTSIKKVLVYIYIYMWRWVQITPGIILKSYTFSKLLDLNKSNGQKRN